ncbi:zinc finger, CCHC-type containing protein [Tanacetum coccineum]|uniref:Zinc finger, CCHC-type containing protein n=1 Tax=Tanacetum coccineum TaxID=301880 RepID=A0ABQ4YM91_9ASTR
MKIGSKTELVTTSRYVVPTGRVKVPAGRYVVPTGKDNVIVSAGSTKVIPAGRTILVLNVESAKELWDSLESKHMAEDASSKKFLGKGKEVGGPSVNMMEEGGKNKNNKQNKGKKRSFKENNSSFGSNKKPKLECGKTGHFKRDCRSGNKKNNASASGSGKGSKDQSQDQGQNLVHVWNRFVKYSVSLSSKSFYVQVDAITWWIDFGATTHVCKDRCWFKTYEPMEDGSVLYMGDDHFAPVHGKGSIVLEFSYGISITLFNVLYVPKLRKNLIYVHVSNKYGYKQVYESDKYILSKSGVFVRLGYYNNGMFMLNLNKVSNDSGSVYMPSSTVVNSLLWHARLRHVHYKIMLEMLKDDLIPAIDENPENVLLMMPLGIIHETTSPYTPQQNGVVERKNKALKEMVNSMLSCSGFSDGFWGETILMACYLFNRVPNKRNKTTPYEPWPKDIIPNSDKSQRDDHSNDVPSETPEPRREEIDDEIGSIMENYTWVLSNLPRGLRQKEGINYFDTYALVARITTIRLLFGLAAFHNLVIHQIDVKTTFLNGDLEEEVYMKQSEGFVMPSNEHKFSMKDMGEADVILGIKIKRENKGIVITQSHYIEKYSRNLIVKIVLLWINHVEDSSSTSGSVFLLGGVAISWDSKKQTCITSSTMESDFVALAAAGKEVEWLRNLIHEISTRLKPITPTFIYYDSAVTLVRAYNQIYNGKSRNLGVRHGMNMELIMNGVVSIEFVRSQNNLDDHLTKGLARDLVVKLVIGMGLKSI